MTALDIIRLNRSEGIGSTDAKRIVENDWIDLYYEKVGDKEPVDLSAVFPVQLGVYTERFHLEWLANRERFTLEDVAERQYHDTHPFMFCHLDGWHKESGTFVEVKHSNSRATVREKAEYYMPQVQHAMACTGTPNCYFSIIAGNSEPDWCLIDRNQEYIERLIEMEKAFWWHVENKVAPDITPKGEQAQLKVIGSTTPIDGRKPYDMTTNNEWTVKAKDYLDHEEAAALFEAAKKDLKALVPEDASEAKGHGLCIKRDKRGSLRFYKES